MKTNQFYHLENHSLTTRKIIKYFGRSKDFRNMKNYIFLFFKSLNFTKFLFITNKSSIILLVNY